MGVGPTFHSPYLAEEEAGLDKAVCFASVNGNAKVAVFADGMMFLYPEGDPDSSGVHNVRSSADVQDKMFLGWGQGPWDWKKSLPQDQLPLCTLRF